MADQKLIVAHEQRKGRMEDEIKVVPKMAELSQNGFAINGR